MKSLRILLLFAFVALFFSTPAQSETGKFSPAAGEPGESKILLVDDDMELQLSGPYLEATHIVTALNDGGYSYDIFRTGQFDGDNYEIPHGDEGLSMLDNYEVIIWYSGWNTNIMSSSETSVMGDYLDGECGSSLEDFCVEENRNIILLTSMIDWVDYNNGNFLNTYLHSDTDVSSYLVVDGTSNPMDGVSDSIFDGKEYATDTAGTYYMDRPCGIKPTGSEATGAFWMDVRKGEADGHEYHAVQYPSEPAASSANHKAFTFANEIGVFNERSERADFFATILNWMEVEKETTQDNDLGISSLEIPRHHAHGEIEKYVPIEIKVGVTNYGNEPVISVNVRLKIKTEEGLVFYDNSLDTRAFPEGHSMHIEEVLEPGETIFFNFTKANDRFQRMYEGESDYLAIHTMMRLSGLHTLNVEVDGSDANPSNDKIITKIFSAVYIHTFEPDDAGYSYYLGDTDDNGASSYEGVNWHLVDSYDWDADGCGWASEVPENCEDDEGTLNHTGLYVAKNGDYAIASFNQNSWYKDDANSDECDWGDMGDPDCPKFVPNPNQDDYVQFGPFDFSGMNEVVVNYFYSGCLESGDYHNLQMSKDDGYSWSNIYSETDFCANKGSWYMHQGQNTRYPGLELDSEWYGSDDTASVYIRIQMDTDDDQITESSEQPYSGLFIDDFIIRGTERITRDVAVGDITIDSDFDVKDDGGNPLSREINVTALNLGQEGWSDLPIQLSVTNLQGEDVSDYLDETQFYVWSLSGYSKYGDLASGQNDLFAVFETPGTNTYYLTVEILTPAGKDFFPENNSKTVEFRIFDTFFYDNFDVDAYGYTEVERTTSTENRWMLLNKDGYAYSGLYALQYAEEDTHDSENPTTVGGSDDGIITRDDWDRDGDGTKYQTDVNLDLRAAYKPILTFAIKWDLGPGDRLEIRAATDFDSNNKLSSGTWIILKTYEGDCDCPFLSEDKDTWLLEELSLEAFEGYQTWIEFRVVTTNGGGKGVLIDDLAIIGNEYQNNIMITDVDLGIKFPGRENDLSITIRAAGLEEQSDITVAARIIDSNGLRVWPTDRTFNFFTIPGALAKGEEFTVNPSTADGDWRYGSELEEGTYFIYVMALRDDDVQVPDENPENNIWMESFDLMFLDSDNDGLTDNVDECLDTIAGEEVDEYGCSDSQKDSDSDGITDNMDECPDTIAGEEVDEYGCSTSQKDSDNDGITDNYDECADTSYFNVTINGTIHLSNETDMKGCSPYQLDDDNDGVMNDKDECPDTLPLSSGKNVTEFGCLEEADNSVVSCTSNSFMNNIYTQSGSSELLIGKASYHFVSEDNVYINWESFGSGVRLDNGQLVFTKTFTETTFDYESRTFYGTIDFSDPEGTTMNGASSYVYQMIFSEDYTTISSGYYSIYSEENLLVSTQFGEGGLKYYLLCDILATDYTPAEVDSTSDNTYEGDDPGECSDGADNDQDGQFDCDDAACKGSPDCKAGAGSDIEEIESGGLSSISLIPVIGLLALITIIRRRFNH